MTLFVRIALTDDIQFLPIQQTLIGQHPHKAIEAPIIIHHAVTDAPLLPVLGTLLLLLAHDHLPLGKIADDHSPFSQFAGDEVRGFVQTVPLFVTLLFSNALVHLGEMEVVAGFLFAPVPLEPDLVQLLIVPAIALEAANVVEAPLIGVAYR